MAKLPNFSDLPLRKGDPHHSAWGLYGENDELGFLNRLTEDVVLEAAKEIRTGKRISLDWPLDAQGDIPFFGRQAFHKHLYQKPPRIVNDDVWTFNTQTSSQWDGLRHFAYQKEQKFYNGVTLEDIHGDHATNVNGIHAWSEQGLVGRGILLDWHSWRLKNNVKYDAFKTGSIPLAQLREVAKDQGVEIKFGDILLIRSGTSTRLSSRSELDTEEHQATWRRCRLRLREWSKAKRCFNGFGKTSLLWRETSRRSNVGKDYLLHEVLLAGWGCPIGELFDLEALAEHCAKEKRWSFFLTSKVCNVPGGVASPPNILAIF
ncbi:hypothetical protein MPH_02521 [Macrophomina phaseolina MS6]|uniref:Cyclase n=1 Tax=Macrophomina phaseolina (strain MS6) TaxID=1126212 RepID=K2SCN2_MACPH|nr:hypothetical protein MPH_02521 [Macrophomina phaseolina MS6]